MKKCWLTQEDPEEHLCFSLALQEPDEGSIGSLELTDAEFTEFCEVTYAWVCWQLRLAKVFIDPEDGPGQGGAPQ